MHMTKYAVGSRYGGWPCTALERPVDTKDLVAPYTRPCALGLVMGTRTPTAGEFAPESAEPSAELAHAAASEKGRPAPRTPSIPSAGARSTTGRASGRTTGRAHIAARTGRRSIRAAI